MTEVGEKTRRQRDILALVRKQPIANQDALAAALAQGGCWVTQSTLSRDLKELRVLRGPTDSGYRYLPAGDESGRPPLPARIGSLAPAEVLSVEANESAVVVRTLVGRAQGVAVYLDGLGQKTCSEPSPATTRYRQPPAARRRSAGRVRSRAWAYRPEPG